MHRTLDSTASPLPGPTAFVCAFVAFLTKEMQAASLPLDPGPASWPAVTNKMPQDGPGASLECLHLLPPACLHLLPCISSPAKLLEAPKSSLVSLSLSLLDPSGAPKSASPKPKASHFSVLHRARPSWVSEALLFPSPCSESGRVTRHTSVPCGGTERPPPSLLHASATLRPSILIQQRRLAPVLCQMPCKG